MYQSSREAVDNLLCGQAAAFLPVHDSPGQEVVSKWIGQGMPTDEQAGSPDPVTHFGYDMAPVGGWFDWMPEPGEPTVLENTAEWRLLRYGNGAVLRWWKDRSGAPEQVAFAMSSRAVWERDYRPGLQDFDASRVDLDSARQQLSRRRQEGKWTFYEHQFLWENLRASLGDVGMLVALLEDPAWIHDFNRVYTEVWKAGFRLLIEQAGKPDGIWIYEDLGYRDRLFCRPELLRELFLPYYRELVDFFADYDLPVVLHSCGYQAPMIPLAIEAGFRGLNPMEVRAGNDLLGYADTYGDRLVFVGGFDACLLESASPLQIEEAVCLHIEGMRERGARFLFGTDHSLSSNVDYATYCLAMDVYRRYRS